MFLGSKKAEYYYYLSKTVVVATKLVVKEPAKHIYWKTASLNLTERTCY